MTPNMASKNDAWHGVGLSYFKIIDAMAGIVFDAMFDVKKLADFHIGNEILVLIVLSTISETSSRFKVKTAQIA